MSRSGKKLFLPAHTFILHIVPVCLAVTRLAGTVDELVATAGDNPLRDLPSQTCFRSSVISRQIPETISILSL